MTEGLLTLLDEQALRGAETARLRLLLFDALYSDRNFLRIRGLEIDSRRYQIF
jgi:hypothetical protein